MPRSISPDHYEWFIAKALEPVTADSGSKYPCTQEDIDLYQCEPLCVKRPKYDEVVVMSKFDYNLGKRLDKKTLRRIENLQIAARDGDCGPDIVIKALRDIDIVCFSNSLQGKVNVQYVTERRMRKVIGDMGGRPLPAGATSEREGGFSEVSLYAPAIFDPRRPCPFERMWRTVIKHLAVRSQDVSHLECLRNR